jgi:preprotein translocase subunit SecA
VEYKREAFELFQRLMWQIQNDVVSLFFRSKIQIDVPVSENFDAEAFARSHGMEKQYVEGADEEMDAQQIAPLEALSTAETTGDLA